MRSLVQHNSEYLKDGEEKHHKAFDDSTLEVVGRAEGTLDDQQVFHSKEDVSGLITVKAKDQLIPCAICQRRSVPFMPAYYCRVCTTIWFMMGDECVRESTKVWHSEQKLSPLELERIQWNIDNPSTHTSWQPFMEHITKDLPDLLEQIPKGLRW